MAAAFRHASRSLSSLASPLLGRTAVTSNFPRLLTRSSPSGTLAISHRRFARRIVATSSSPASPSTTTASTASPTSTPSPSSTSIPDVTSTNNGSDAADVSGSALRRKFLNFYASRGHAVLPSASLVPQDPTVLLTIAGMLPFKPVFLGQEPPSVPRATSSQKCVRTNDVDNVGRTARHHTFFEMLGNFSFGDYFKREAAQWAWQLATQEFGIPADRIWISVFEEDDEAFAIWRDEIGVPPHRILRLGAEDNFWSSGATGPCGPCSELYYDFHPERGVEGADLNDDSRFIEFYNLVFMESNRLEDGRLEPLKSKNIDTGLGLERLAQILQGVPNNYETDLIFPIIQVAADMAGIDYHSADEKTKMKLKVIGDHARAVVFLVSDGVSPSNVGRGYVVRRLIRRLVRTGRLLGVRAPASTLDSQPTATATATASLDAATAAEGRNGSGRSSSSGTISSGSGGEEGDAFLPVIAEKVILLSTDIDPQVSANKDRILSELRREELRFVQTLERGERMLSDLLAAAKREGEGEGGAVLLGRDVFVLYDTYGFPVEITEEAANEMGVRVDMEGFEQEMEKQRKQSQAAHAAVKLAVGGAVSDLASQLPTTVFTGYHSLTGSARILALVSEDGRVVDRVTAGEQVDVVLDSTPFYAEGGGQIGDCGQLRVEEGGGGGERGLLSVRDVQKGGGGLFLHRGRVEEGEVKVGQTMGAVVDATLRERAQAHHTATHLLQSALRLVLGPDVSQAGSLVSFQRLRFDFSFPRGLTREEVSRVEALVNGWIGEAAAVAAREMSLQEAKAAGAIAMFGEKYGEEVRVVDVPGISMELCGGTHVDNTARIRAFKVLSEGGIASGVRRIEAVAGPAAVELLNQWDALVTGLAGSLKVKPEDIPSRVSSLQDELRSARSELEKALADLAVAKAESLVSQAETVGSNKTKVLVASLPSLSADSLKSAADRLSFLLSDPSAVVLGSADEEGGKVALVAAFSPSVVASGLQAGKFVGALAKACGGGGGGRPNFAQAGGRQPEKLPEVLEAARVDLRAKLAQ